jgi:hypothetical protein
MKFLKSLLMGTGGVVFAGLVLALLAPKAIHAVVATAVQVVNTSANPAITEDASRLASQIVTVQCVYSNSFRPSCSPLLPTGAAGALPGPNGGYVVPVNQFFVIKSLDCVLSNSVSSYIAIWTILNPSYQDAEDLVLPANGQISFSSGIVAGPGTEVAPNLLTTYHGTVTLHGYLTPN